MDYKKKYKDAQKWIESVYTELSHERQMEAEAFFPELKESEDERIRKWCISHFKECINVIKDNDEYKEYLSNKVIAWLEKQGEQKEYTFKSLPRLLDMIEPTSRAKAYCQKLVDSLVNEGYSTDAKIVGECLKKMNGEEVSLVTMDENQGEQILANSAKTCKIEPKFKVGDWITGDENITMHIVKVGDNFYEVEYVDGSTAFPYMYNVDKNFHLWTIQDAKDGDVLVSAEVIFIFNKVHSVWINCHCSLHKDESFIDEDYDLMHIKYSKEVYPATKEECDLLFKKMKEVGYEWNAEKKELKKIEQKSIEENKRNVGKTSSNWSEEDEYIAEKLLGWLDTLVNYIHHDAIVSLDLRRERMQQVEKIKTWLESLKEKLTETKGGEV